MLQWREMRLLTRKDAAGQLRISTRHLDRMIERGELPVLRLGRSVRIRPADLDAFIVSSTMGMAPDNERDRHGNDGRDARQAGRTDAPD